MTIAKFESAFSLLFCGRETTLKNLALFCAEAEVNDLLMSCVVKSGSYVLPVGWRLWQKESDREDTGHAHVAMAIAWYMCNATLWCIANVGNTKQPHRCTGGHG